MKKYICFFLIITFSGICFSQNDSTELLKLNSDKSKSEIITRYRSLLMDNIIANNKDKAKELLYYLVQKLDNDSYMALYPLEKWLTCLWLRDFDMMETDVVHADSSLIRKLFYKVQPERDQLHRIINQVFTKDKDFIIFDINNSPSLTKVDKDFFLLFIKSYDTGDRKDYKLNMNSLATAFINENKDSKYETYVRTFIRYEYRPRGFLFGMEMFSGCSILSGNTSEYLKSGGVIGIGFIFGYQKFYLNARGTMVFSGLNHDIIYNNYTWRKNERTEITLPELSLGYNYEILPKMIISPVLGFAWFSILPYDNDQQKNPNLKNLNIPSTGAPIAGIDLGWEFMNATNNNFYHKLVNNFYSCNIRYTIQSIHFSSSFYKNMNGLSHNIAIAVKFGFGGAKRVY